MKEEYLKRLSFERDDTCFNYTAYSVAVVVKEHRYFHKRAHDIFVVQQTAARLLLSGCTAI